MTASKDEFPEPNFSDLGVDADIQAGLRDLGYQQPLAVQRVAIPVILEGRDVSMRAKTGSGKTAAFGIPLLQRIDRRRRRPSLLVLAPTRELAAQLGTELRAIGKHRGLEVATAYGGVPVEEQKKRLQAGIDVLAATPGRLLDLSQQKAVRLADFQAVVLDEADEMLSMGFFEDVTKIMDACQGAKQVIILSASLEQDTAALVDRYTRDVIRIDLSADKLSVEGIRNIYYLIGDDLPRHHYLLHVLAVEQPHSAIVFVNTRQDAGVLTTVLAREGWRAEMISGQLPQRERERVMAAIKDQRLKLLVATDLAARGIDISHLSHVINFSLPEDPAIFLHRVGRTGRVDREGTAVSLVSGKRVHTLGVLERQFGIKFERKEFPPATEMTKLLNRARITALLEAAGQNIADGYLALAGEICSHPRGHEIVAYLLKRHADSVHDEKRSLDNRPQAEPPRRRRRRSPPRRRRR
ncbi:MAG: DEAD/DEAH box helicase [Deltaproteobacteria bacterium]|nr:MAG: DEAD/DEAH box helicase [Deltaproteobacteria bacterium]